MQAEQLKKITGYFIEEANEHLETIEQGLATLQATINDTEIAKEVYRAAHSIKGGAAMLEIESVRRTAHRLEDYFKLLKDSPVQADPTLESLFHQVFHALQTLVGELEKSYTVPEEIAQGIMSEIEPVFERTQTHLEQLLNGAKTPEIAISSTEGHITKEQSASTGNLLGDLLQEGNGDAASAEAAVDAESKTTRSPEVGMAELSTLADLFEGTISELDRTLQGESGTFVQSNSNTEVFEESNTPNFEENGSDLDDLLDRLMDSAESSEPAPEQTESKASSGTEDFAFLDDLVADDSDEPSEESLEAVNAFDSLADLFGEDFSFETPVESGTNSSSPHLNGHQQPDSSEETLDDLFADFSGEAEDDSADFSELLDISAPAEEPKRDIVLEAPIEKSEELFAEETADALEEISEVPRAESDLDALLGDFLSLEEASTPAEAPGNNELDSALAGLFDSDLSTLEELETETPVAEEYSPQAPQPYEMGNSLADLESFFADPSPVEESVPPPPPQTASDLSESVEEPLESEVDRRPSLNYYDHFDELEELIEQPLEAELRDRAETLGDRELFVRLEALLESSSTPATPVTIESVAPSIETAQSPPSPTNRQSEDEFSDLEELLKDFEQKVGGPPSTRRKTRKTRSRSTKPKVEQTLKVPVRQMDNLSNLMGELVVNRNSLEGDEDKLRQSLDTLMQQVQNLSDVGGRMQDLYERSLLEDALFKSRQEYRAQPGNELGPPGEGEEDYDSLEMDSFTKFHELAQEVIEMIVRVRESASDIALWVDDIDLVARSLRQVTSQLQEGLTKARMVPFARTADRLPLAVRKIAPQLSKQANLQVEGRETLIDKMILEHLSDPLTHLVNNALTHGVETPDIRVANSKEPAGQITVRALQQGNQTVISVSDDGAGINPQRVKAKAIEKGVITPGEAKQLSDIDVYDLLFHAGFSTKDSADDFSGRGVGLDVVRTSIMEIRGAVSIDSQLGRGTTFTIRLPLTLSICKALCCVSENSPMAFPMDGVEDMLDLPVTHVRTTEDNHQYIQWRDVQLHYCPLSALLSYNRKLGRAPIYAGQRDDNMVSVVVLRSATSFLAIGVEQVLGEQEIVIKQINGPVPKPVGIAGATVQADGRIMAIADVLELIQIAEGRIRKDTSSLWKDSEPQSAVANDRAEPMVLIVDDSITVRSLLSMTFEKSGYQVEQAKDGQDAWDKLRGGLPCDIVFCDIEMPRVDGLELLGRIQKDEKLAETPVAMLTSRGAERHRRVAAELGASGYFTKPYLEEVLLDAAQRMIDGEVLLDGSTREHRSKPSPSPLMGQAENLTLSAAPAPDPALKTPKVLIVDDSVTVRSLLSIAFESAGYEVAQARDGQDAWNQLKGGLECDIAFLDIEMPKMDGLELLERIQKDETLNSIPVAMLTSRGAQKMQQRAAERGASGYFTKPYVEQDLLRAAQRLRNGEVLLAGSTRKPQPLEPTSPTPPEPEPQSAPPVMPTVQELPPHPKVLIVDDSVTVRSLLSMTFEKVGYEVVQARDGQDAWDRLNAGLDVNVAFLDIEMPRMDGLTLLSNIQEDERFKDLPVAMLTSRGAQKMKQRAAELGAKGYFVKPYIEDVLLDSARRLIAGEVLLEVEA
ncbi:response regulator [Lusitaniella coriacea]|nr:response regulator [Lusitaniella coriacea]